MQAPIDLERLRQFSDGSPEGLRQLVQMLLDQVDVTSADLRSAVVQARPDALSAIAHRGAGMAGACGARDLAGVLGRLEQLGDTAGLDGLDAVMKEAEAEFARLQEFLSTFVQPEKGSE